MPPAQVLGKSVMVVEDDWQSRRALTLALEAAGYAVRQATDGAAALRQLRYGPPPDLILLDMALPVMNGWEFLERKAQEPELAGVPVIVFSAAYEAPPPAAPSLGIAKFLAKPGGGEALTAIDDLFAALKPH